MDDIDAELMAPVDPEELERRVNEILGTQQRNNTRIDDMTLPQLIESLERNLARAH